MEKIYAPWREKYVKRAVKTRDKTSTKKECAFCKQIDEDKDEENFILKRFDHSFVIFNLYPYNAGHLMVLPMKHEGTLEQLSSTIRAEMMEATNISITILEKVLNPQGFNMGLNMGSAGGGGIPSHLHFHIVPRWQGDTNFMPIIGGTKAISVDLKALYGNLKKSFDTL